MAWRVQLARIVNSGVVSGGKPQSIAPCDKPPASRLGLNNLLHFAS
jgi:hypothetical protein